MNIRRLLVSLSISAALAGGCTQAGTSPQPTSPGAAATASPARTEAGTGAPAGSPPEVPATTMPPAESPSATNEYGY